MASWSWITNHAAHAHATIHAIGMIHSLRRRRWRLTGIRVRSTWGVDVVLIIHGAGLVLRGVSLGREGESRAGLAIEDLDLVALARLNNESLELLKSILPDLVRDIVAWLLDGGMNGGNNRTRVDRDFEGCRERGSCSWKCGVACGCLLERLLLLLALLYLLAEGGELEFGGGEGGFEGVVADERDRSRATSN